jgi:hypothetical protein
MAHSTPADPHTPASPSAEQSEPPKRKRRWLRIVLIIVLLLVVLIALLPTIASTGPVRGMILSRANDAIQGQIAIDSLSLGWFSGQRIEGITITDPQDRQVVAVAVVEWSRGLLGAVFAGLDLGEVTVDQPDLTLYVKPEGGVSLSDAVAPKKPSEPKEEPSEPFDTEGLKLAARLTGGRVRIVQPDGEEYVVEDINVSTELEGLNRLTAAFSAVAQDGATLTAQADLRDVFADGALALQNASGKVTVKTEPALDLAPLLAIAVPDAKTTGKVKLDIAAKLAPGQSTAKYNIAANNLSVATPGTDVQPADVALTGTAAIAGNLLSANAKLLGPLGDLSIDLKKLDLAGQMPEDPAGSIMAGESVVLPELHLLSGGKIDLAAAGRTIPGLMRLKDGVRVAGGRILVQDLDIRGGQEPSAKGAVTAEFIFKVKDRLRSWKPIVAKFNVATVEQDGSPLLSVSDTQVTAPFAKLTANGTATQFRADVVGNLSALRNHMQSIAYMQDSRLAGTVTGSMQVDQASSDTRTFTVQLQADNVQTGSAEADKNGTKPKPPRTLNAQLHFKADARETTDLWSLKGRLTILKLVLSDVGEVFPGEQPTLLHDLRMHAEQQTLDVAKLAFDSKVLTLNLAGSVADLDADRTLDLKGDYAADWPEVSRIVGKMNPDALKDIAMAGRSAGPIVVTGPASNPEIKPGFRKMDASTQLGWGGGSQVMGLTLGEATFKPSMDDAVVTLPPGQATANGGMLRLRGKADLRGEEPQLSIPGKLAALEKVQINKEVGQAILSRINPLLGKVSKLEGILSLDLEDLDVPLGESIKTRGTGKGRLDLSNVVLSPTGPMATLFKLMGKKDGSYPVQTRPVDFELRNGRIHYKNFAMVIGKSMDVTFRGSVGFDNTVDLVVSVPVTSGLLGSLGLPGGGKGLEGMRVEIPIVGTRESPRLELAKIDKKALSEKLLKQGVKGLLGGDRKEGESGSGDLRKKLPGLLDGGSKDKPKPDAPKDASESGANPSSAQPKEKDMEDLGKKLLEGLGGLGQKQPDTQPAR